MSTTKHNQSSNDTLARLLAGENFTVQHVPNAQTAMFDTQSRTLYLPVWEDASEHLNHMLIGHEVGHALWTPAGTSVVQDAINSIDAKRPNRVKMFLNICEDARIERMIQRRFPGLRKDFSVAYPELLNSGMRSSILPKPIDQMPFIDRLNINFKFGATIPQTFNAEERALIDAVGSAESFEDMVAAAKSCYAYAKREAQEKQNQQGQPGKQQGQPGKSGKQQKQSDPTAAPAPESWDDNDSEQGESGESGESKPNNSGIDSDDDGSTADSRAGESAESDSGSMGGEGAGGTDAETGTSGDSFAESDLGGDSQQAIEAAASQKTASQNKSANLFQNIDIDAPSDINPNLVVPYREIYRIMYPGHLSDKNNLATAQSRVKAFNAKMAGPITNMVNEFRRKAQARVARRARVAPTGRIDPDKIKNYRFSDDIFLKSVMLPKGKNHGFMMFVDFSSSMSSIIDDTIKQCLILAEFCRKIRVPFEVYGFYNGGLPRTVDSKYQSITCAFDDITAKDAAKSGTSFSRLHLLQILSSKMSQMEFNNAKIQLLTFGARSGSSEGFSLCGTPLDISLMCSIPMVRAFKKANRVQIVNTIVLTDGDSEQLSYNSAANVIWRDRQSGGWFSQSGKLALRNGDYPSFGRPITLEIVRFCRRATGCNYICFNLSGNVPANHQKAYADNKYAVGTDGYNAEFFMQPELLSTESRQSTTGSAEALMSSAEAKKRLLTVVRLFVEMVAKQSDAANSVQ